jgi:hypothetical protein
MIGFASNEWLTLPMTDLVETSASVRRFRIEGGLLLLEERANCLFAYSDTARHVWDLIGPGRTEKDLASEFAQAWGIPLSRALTDLRSILAQWRSQGLLADGKKQAPWVAPGPGIIVDRHCAPPFQSASEWTCTIRGVTIAFAIENELIATIRSMLKNLETPGAPPQARMELRSAASGEAMLFCDGVERICTRDWGLLVGSLWQAILERIHPNRAWLALIHGAAVARGGKGIALVGPSGSGKTTLTAALIDNGFDYFADDLVALSAPEGMVVPWPMPLSIKAGSFEVLAPHCRELAHAPGYRTKGMDARLLVPPLSSWDAEPVRLRSLIFLCYVDGAAPTLKRISSFQAIERLLTDRISLGSPITADRVVALLTWLGDTPAYVATYSKLDDGTRLIEEGSR